MRIHKEFSLKKMVFLQLWMLKIVSMISEKFIKIIIDNKKYVSYSYLRLQNHFETTLSMHNLEKILFSEQKLLTYPQNIFKKVNKKRKWLSITITINKFRSGINGAFHTSNLFYIAKKKIFDYVNIVNNCNSYSEPKAILSGTTIWVFFMEDILMKRFIIFGTQ